MKKTGILALLLGFVLLLLTLRCAGPLLQDDPIQKLGFFLPVLSITVLIVGYSLLLWSLASARIESVSLVLLNLYGALVAISFLALCSNRISSMVTVAPEVLAGCIVFALALLSTEKKESRWAALAADREGAPAEEESKQKA